MFAIEGPIVMKVAPAGIFFSIQSPASRPPGTPPVPATNVPDVAGVMSCTLKSSKERATTATVEVLIKALLIRIRFFRREISSGHQRAIARPARTAMGDAIGNKY